MELTRILMSVGPSIQIITLIFGQLRCRYQDVVELADLVSKLPNGPFCRTAVDAWKFEDKTYQMTSHMQRFSGISASGVARILYRCACDTDCDGDYYDTIEAEERYEQMNVD
jgi:hypothetical protein